MGGRVDRRLAAERTYGDCPECGGRYWLRADLTLPKHPRGSAPPCDGVGEKSPSALIWARLEREAAGADENTMLGQVTLHLIQQAIDGELTLTCDDFEDDACPIKYGLPEHGGMRRAEA